MSGINAVYREAKKQLPGVTVEAVKKFLWSQDSYTLHKPIKKRFPQNRIIAAGMDTDWQADLMDLRQFQKFNKGFTMVLVVVDVLSKYLWCVPLKNKKPETVAKAFAGILKQSKRKPWRLCTDRGHEFGTKFKDLMETKDITHFHATNPEVKASVAERQIKTLKGKIFKHFTKTKKFDWIDVLPNIVTGINNSVSTVTKMAPAEVNEGNARKVRSTMYNLPKPKPVKFKFKVGDLVRITKEKGKLARGYKANFTQEVFVISERLARLPPVYRLQDKSGDPIHGVFYGEELSRVYKRGKRS
jgi:hypothetical protein